MGILTAIKPKRIFYGWWIVLAGAATMGISGTLSLQGLGTLFVPIRAEFGWSRTALNFAYSLMRLEAGLLGPVEGFLIDRFGPRKLMIIGVTMTSVGLVLLTLVRTLPAFYAVFVLLLAVGSSIGFWVPIATAVSNWFVRKRGLALGLMMSGAAASVFLLPLLGWLITTFGWRNAAYMVAAVGWMVGLPLAMVMRHRPEQYGYLPDGTAAEPAQADGGKERAVGHGLASVAGEVHFTPLEALRAPSFWFLTLAHSIGLGALFSVFGNQALHMVNEGFTLQEASFIVGLITAPQALSRVALGWAGDLFPKRYLIAVCFIISALGLLIDAHAKTLWMMIPFVVLFGIGDGGRGVLINALRSDYFGRRNWATIQGTSGMITTVGTFGAPVLLGIIADTTGSYGPAFYMLAALNLVGLVLILAARQPKAPARPGVDLRTS